MIDAPMQLLEPTGQAWNAIHSVCVCVYISPFISFGRLQINEEAAEKQTSQDHHKLATLATSPSN